MTLAPLNSLEQGDREGAANQVMAIVAFFEGMEKHHKARGIYNPEKLPDPDGRIRNGWFDDAADRLIACKDHSFQDSQVLQGSLEEFLRRFTFTYW